jgi:ferredoxin-fold anticodon binding domain-containing protein
MSYQHVENLLIRYRGKAVDIKTISGGVYEGIVNDVTNDYVALKVNDSAGGENIVFVLLHAVESVLSQRSG